MARRDHLWRATSGPPDQLRPRTIYCVTDMYDDHIKTDLSATNQKSVITRQIIDMMQPTYVTMLRALASVAETYTESE